MLTGRLPFRGDHPLSVAHAIIHETPAPPSSLKPDVPRYWDRIVLRALEKSPEDRFARISEAAASSSAARPRRRPPAVAGFRRRGTSPRSRCFPSWT